MNQAITDLQQRVLHQLQTIYAEIELQESLELLSQRLLEIMQISPGGHPPAAHESLWDETEIAMITYGDSIQQEGEKPLNTLHHFLNAHLQGTISSVHILPFFPWSSDDGFAVINFSSVNDALGDWRDIEAISRDYRG